jgi:hypothetical protein
MASVICYGGAQPSDGNFADVVAVDHEIIRVIERRQREQHRFKISKRSKRNQASAAGRGDDLLGPTRLPAFWNRWARTPVKRLRATIHCSHTLGENKVDINDHKRQNGQTDNQQCIYWTLPQLYLR